MRDYRSSHADSSPKENTGEVKFFFLFSSHDSMISTYIGVLAHPCRTCTNLTQACHRELSTECHSSLIEQPSNRVALRLDAYVPHVSAFIIPGAMWGLVHKVTHYSLHLCGRSALSICQGLQMFSRRFVIQGEYRKSKVLLSLFFS